jgi:hypothetical protein
MRRVRGGHIVGSFQVKPTSATPPTRIALKALSFFLASPGDVSEERRTLKRWLEPQLQDHGHELYAYEYDTGIAFHAGATFQDQIPYPSDELARVTVCILGERLGGDVGDAFRVPDGFEKWLAEWQRPLGSPISSPGAREHEGIIPLTGTLFELLDAIRAVERDQDRKVLIFVKGSAATVPTRKWNENPKLEDVSLARKFGMSEEHDRLTELAKNGEQGAAEAESYLSGEYRKQLSYVDAVLRILKQKARSFETFANPAVLRERLLHHTSPENSARFEKRGGESGATR